ncbi:retinol dehydrogenase 12-like isoform X2 [Culicoides brevitarsis]|uniref:retinol dehydrogenase 12-like isoform X2 n=1 Tax=Culicoides brevitarsis TaxID=469753 RepID=UPI00307BC28F
MAEESLLWLFLLILLPIVAYLYRLFIQGASYKKQNRIDGKVVIITGANTGIGKETAIELAKRGGKIYLACRNKAKAIEAQKDVIQQSGSSNVFVEILDLSSLESVRDFAKRFMTLEDHLDLLINNAGIMACPKMLTKDGFEMQLGTNHLGHFLLTNLLLDHLKNSTPSRVVNVSSMAHLFGKINKDDLNSEKSYNSVNAYSQSKLANVMFTRELAKRLQGTGVTTYSLHPGVISTELTRHLSDGIFIIFQNWLIRPLQYIFNKTPKAGAQTTLYCALDPDLEKESGKYYAECKLDKINPLALDDETCKWLWTTSEKLTKLQ